MATRKKDDVNSHIKGSAMSNNNKKIQFNTVFNFNTGLLKLILRVDDCFP